MRFLSVSTGVLDCLVMPSGLLCCFVGFGGDQDFHRLDGCCLEQREALGCLLSS